MAETSRESSHPAHPAGERATVAGANMPSDPTRKAETPQLGARRTTFARTAADQADMPMHTGRISETPKLGQSPANTRRN
jgi:hypothetical protein